MLSVVLLARNTRNGVTLCLQSLVQTIAALGLPAGEVEYVLIDDFSDAESEIVGLFRSLRTSVAPSSVQIVRFTSHRHYAYGLAVGLSLARGENVLFVSHDMVVPPACVRTLLAAVQSDPRVGIARPVSQHMDGESQLLIKPPPGTPLRDTNEVAAFSRFVARYHGLRIFEPALLIGDAMLITRACIDRIGVFDTRFFGFMGDVDYGVRARRSGFTFVTAPGAWLHHEGSGFRKDTARAAGTEAEKQLADQISADAAAAWQLFRQKWDPTLPAAGRKLTAAQVKHLYEAPPASQFDMRQAPIAIDPVVCEVH
jgi:GT2 family glycosyltransferase